MKARSECKTQTNRLLSPLKLQIGRASPSKWAVYFAKFAFGASSPSGFETSRGCHFVAGRSSPSRSTYLDSRKAINKNRNMQATFWGRCGRGRTRSRRVVLGRPGAASGASRRACSHRSSQGSGDPNGAGKENITNMNRAQNRCY